MNSIDDQHVPMRTWNDETTVKCYTCDLIEQNQCLYNRVSFSQKSTYLLHECLGPDIPYSTVKRANTPENATLFWEENENLKSNLANKLLPIVQTELINKTDYCKFYFVLLEIYGQNK